MADLVIFVGQTNYRSKASGLGKLIGFRPFREPEKALASVGL